MIYFEGWVLTFGGMNYHFLVWVISSVSCSILHPTQRFPSNHPIHPLIAYAATSVSDSVITLGDTLCTLSNLPKSPPPSWQCQDFESFWNTHPSHINESHKAWSRERTISKEKQFSIRVRTGYIVIVIGKKGWENPIYKSRSPEIHYWWSLVASLSC